MKRESCNIHQVKQIKQYKTKSFKVTRRCNLKILERCRVTFTANGKRELQVEKFLKMQNEVIKTVQNISDG